MKRQQGRPQSATQAWLMRWRQRHRHCRMTKRGCDGSVRCTQPVASRLHGEDSQRGGGRGGWQEWRQGVRDKVGTVTWEGERETERQGWRMGQGENFYLGGCWLVFAWKKIKELDSGVALSLPIISLTLPSLVLYFDLPFSSCDQPSLFFIPVLLTSPSPPPFPHPFPVSFFFLFPFTPQSDTRAQR